MMGSLTMLVGRTAIALALCLASTGMAKAGMRTCGSQEPVVTINEMFAALYACWEPPANAGGLSMTLTFSLRSNGTIIGEPRQTHASLGEDERLNEAFVHSVNKALDRALQLPLCTS